MKHSLLVRDCNLSQCMDNTKETNSFKTIKCTILQSYKHSKSLTYMACSSVLVMLLFYMNSYSISNVITTTHAVYIL